MKKERGRKERKREEKGERAEEARAGVRRRGKITSIRPWSTYPDGSWSHMPDELAS